MQNSDDGGAPIPDLASLPKIFICTPVYGTPTTASVSLAYHQRHLALVKDPLIASGAMFVNADLVRARSRAVMAFVDPPAGHPKCDWLLFWDADVIPEDMRIVGVLVRVAKDLGLEVVGLPYPHKSVNFETIADAVRNEAEQAEFGRQTGVELEALGQTVPYHSKTSGQEMSVITYGDPGKERRFMIAEVEALGFGFMLLSRQCCEAMLEAYRDELVFKDSQDGVRTDVVGLFQLVIDPETRILLSEDYSFCYRWRALGGKVYCAGETASHIGGHVFKGHPIIHVDPAGPR